MWPAEARLRRAAPLQGPSSLVDLFACLLDKVWKYIELKIDDISEDGSRRKKRLGQPVGKGQPPVK